MRGAESGRKMLTLCSCWLSFLYFEHLKFSLFLWISVFSCYLSHTFSSWLRIISDLSLSHLRLFATPWTAARQASLSSTNSCCLLKLMSIESLMPSSHLNVCHPLFLPSIFHSITVFFNRSVLRIRWPEYWSFSFSISLPMNIQDWFPLGWIGWISFQSKGLSRVFSNTTVQKHQFFGAQLSL